MAKDEKEIDVDIEREAIALVQGEKDSFEDAVVFVTEKVAFQLRNLIRRLRKNYWGIFDNTTDPNTKKEKTWIPLTESVCDDYVKNIDLDSKDVNWRAKRGIAIKLVDIVRTIVKNWLDANYFGESLDTMERGLAIDGSYVWKSVETKVNGRGKMKRMDVDLLNLYFDMTGHESLNEKYRITERSIQNVSQVKAMDGWINTELVVASEGLHPIESRLGVSQQNPKSSNDIDVWETWGKIPKYLITGKKTDKDEIEGHIVVSGIEGKGPQVHLIEENVKKDEEGNVIRPYSEFHTKRIPGRWLARGPAESVMMLQFWLNTIVNIRITRSMVSQLGIFKIRRNRGITPAIMQKVAANGAILVEDMKDLEQLVIQEASQASYLDEDNIKNWARRVTSTFESVTGEKLPASRPATNAVLETRAAQSSFVMIKNGIGIGIQKWIKQQVLPILTKGLRTGDIVRHTGTVDSLRAFDEYVVNQMTFNQLDKINKQGGRVNAEVVVKEMQRALAKLREMGEDRFVDIIKKIDFSQFDVQVFVTDEEIDKGVLSQNLIAAMTAAPQYQKVLIRHLFDVMGLPMNELERAESETPEMTQPTQPTKAETTTPSRVGTQNATELVSRANAVATV